MINLEKGQRVNVELQRFTIGLGWDTNSSNTGVDFDLDLRQFKTCEYVSPDGRDGAGAVLLDESVCDCLPEPARVSEGRGEKDNRHYDNCGQ